MGAKKPPGVPGSFLGPGGLQAQIPAPLSAVDQAAADPAAADQLAADLLAADLLAAGNAAGNQAAADQADKVAAAEKLLALPGPEDGPQGYGGDEPNQKPSGPWEDAPPLEEDAAASAARAAPIDIQFLNVARENLLPLMASGIHPVSTSGAGNLCGLYALIYSYNALRDLSAPEGTPVPLADNPTAKDLQLYRSSPQFYQDVIQFLKSQNILVFANNKGEPLSEEQVMRQVTGIVPSMLDDYDLNVLQSLLIYLNRTYGTNYVLGHIVHGFNVRWDFINKVWDTGYRVPTSAQAFGVGLHPIMWLYNSNWENESKSLHQNERANPLSHWMGFSSS